MTEVRGPVGLQGSIVLAFESRRAAELANLIRRQGGLPVVVPAMCEVSRSGAAWPSYGPARAAVVAASDARPPSPARGSSGRHRTSGSSSYGCRSGHEQYRSRRRPQDRLVAKETQGVALGDPPPMLPTRWFLFPTCRRATGGSLRSECWPWGHSTPHELGSQRIRPYEVARARAARRAILADVRSVIGQPRARRPSRIGPKRYWSIGSSRMRKQLPVKADPPVRRDGRCRGCGGERPEGAFKHVDPFCSTACARGWHDETIASPSTSN